MKILAEILKEIKKEEKLAEICEAKIWEFKRRLISQEEYKEFEDSNPGLDVDQCARGRMGLTRARKIVRRYIKLVSVE